MHCVGCLRADVRDELMHEGGGRWICGSRDLLTIYFEVYILYMNPIACSMVFADRPSRQYFIGQQLQELVFEKVFLC